MAKFLIKGSYTQTGLQGAVKEGFVAREGYIRGLIASVGAKVEAFYWAYGSDDVVLVVDGEASAAIALSLAVNQSGAVQISTTPLITGAEMDAALAKLPQYRAPGA